MILAYIFLLLFSFYFLAIITNEYFLHSVDYIAKKLKVHSDVAGATLLAAGSSAPELFVAIYAIFVAGHHESLGIATIIGSALFNMFMILGICALFNHSKITWQVIVRDLLFYAFSIVLLLSSFWDGVITASESFLLVSIYLVYVYSVFHWEKWFKYKNHDKLQPQITSRAMRQKDFFHVGIKMLRYIIPLNKQKDNYIQVFVVSVALIGFLSFVLVESAIRISSAFGISEIVIGLVVLAVGTSIPDLLSSIFVSKEGREDMAISNAIGSNVFNILAGLGLPWLFYTSFYNQPITLGTHNGNLLTAMLLLLVATIVVLGVLIFNKWRISKNTGALFVFIYIMYILYIVGKEMLI